LGLFLLDERGIRTAMLDVYMQRMIKHKAQRCQHPALLGQNKTLSYETFVNGMDELAALFFDYANGGK